MASVAIRPEFLDVEGAEVHPTTVYMAYVDSPIAHGDRLVHYSHPIEGIPKSGGWSVFLDHNWWKMPRGFLSNLRDYLGAPIMLDQLGKPIPATQAPPRPTTSACAPGRHTFNGRGPCECGKWKS